jgi:NAD(P)-dependent dehydrogenase (short-subunit alcohol dehydrogenase family)
MSTPSIFELFSLQGQTAVVIGGTGELCGAIAEGFAWRERRSCSWA